jgi:CheY-like chemotaxis protein
VYHDLGPQSQRVYTALRDAILRGDYAPGSRLPGYVELAGQFGVAGVTVRQVLARLEQEGLLTRQQGRGTFVRAQVAPTVLIVDDDPQMRTLLRTYTTRAGHRVVEVASPAEALEVLAHDRSIALVLSDVRLPAPSDGVTFIRTVKRRWPEVPLAAITASPDDLAELHGRPECPVLILSRPVWEHQVRDVFCWVLESRPQLPVPAGTEP